MAYSKTKDNPEDKTKELIEKLENGIKETMTSGKYKAFLDFQSQFHTYSFNNAILIFMQKPDASMVAGYKQWEKFERHVMKGQKGIAILAPRPYKYEKQVDVIDPNTHKKVKDPETGLAKQETKTIEGLRFIKVTVFDVSQTDGKELPLICKELQGNSANAENIIKAIKEISNYPVVEKVIESGAKGYFSRTEGIIAYSKGMSMNQTAKTLIHEHAHSVLHGTDAAAEIDRATKEVQAESVAYIVSNHFGVDTSEYSFDYLASWSSGMELQELKKSLDTIQKTANSIINKMNEVIVKDMKLEKQLPEVHQEPHIDLQSIKEKIVDLYKNEFPAIKHITVDTANIINNLNTQNGQSLTIKEIKKMHKNLGKKFESSNNKSDMREFKLISDVVDDLKHAKLTEKQADAKSNQSLSQQNKVPKIDMDLVQ